MKKSDLSIIANIRNTYRPKRQWSISFWVFVLTPDFTVNWNKLCVFRTKRLNGSTLVNELSVVDANLFHFIEWAMCALQIDAKWWEVRWKIIMSCTTSTAIRWCVCASDGVNCWTHQSKWITFRDDDTHISLRSILYTIALMDWHHRQFVVSITRIPMPNPIYLISVNSVNSKRSEWQTSTTFLLMLMCTIQVDWQSQWTSLNTWREIQSNPNWMGKDEWTNKVANRTTLNSATT